MAYTTHGHQIPGTISEEPKPDRVARCGGVNHCGQCKAEAAFHTTPQTGIDWDIDANRPAADRVELDIWEPGAINLGATAFRRHAVDFQAIKFDGQNFEEIRAFVGTRPAGHNDTRIRLFNPIGTYLPAHLYDKEDPRPTAELWVESAHQWRPFYVGDWVVQQEEDYIPVKEEWLRLNCIELDEQMLELLREHERPKTFREDLASLVNRHSVENGSGTPDFILASYIVRSLQNFEETIKERAEWRGESQDLEQGGFEAGDTLAPGALDGNDGKEVPLVTYEGGQRNEIGTAVIKVTPGEMAVEGKVISSVEAIVLESTDKPIEEPKDESRPSTRFERYQRGGLST